MDKTKPITERMKLYAVWYGMNQRCHTPQHPSYKRWGGRGIFVVPKWRGKSGFEMFIADMGERPKGLTLERKNNNGPYSKTNCTWATASVQRLNQRPRLPLTSKAASQMGHKRWKGISAEDRTKYATEVGKLGGRPRKSGPRCPCGEMTLKRAMARCHKCSAEIVEDILVKVVDKTKRR